VFFGLWHPLTVQGLEIAPQRSVLFPYVQLQDALRFDLWADVLLAPRALGYFSDAERRLVQLEDTVLSESIALRREGGDSLWVPVVINGKHTKEMIVDSGSSMICLPRKIAKDCGIEVGSQHQQITLVLADGSRISAHEVPLDSVRVGKFTVENVVCAVLGEEAIEAEPLLGMSFLGQFKWELDSENKLLKMVKVEAGKTGGN